LFYKNNRFQLVYPILPASIGKLLFETFVTNSTIKEFTYSYQKNVLSAKNIEEFAERLDLVDFELVEIIDDMTTVSL
jgi:hypothetical protein